MFLLGHFHSCIGIAMKNSFFSISKVLTLQLHTALLVRHCMVGCRLSTSGFTNNQKTRDPI